MMDPTAPRTRMPRLAVASRRPRALVCCSHTSRPASLSCLATRAPGRTRPWNPSSASRSAVEAATGDPLVGLDVLRAGVDDDVVGQLRRRRAVVPPGLVEPVAHVLLVERAL